MPRLQQFAVLNFVSQFAASSKPRFLPTVNFGERVETK